MIMLCMITQHEFVQYAISFERGKKASLPHHAYYIRIN
jgi:hypothetical protein